MDRSIHRQRRTFNNSGFLGGAQIGVNTQFNWLLLGLEGDFSWTSAIKGTGTNSLGDSITTSPQWTSTVTGRIGAAFDRLFVYGKGGVAFAEDKSTFTQSAARAQPIRRRGLAGRPAPVWNMRSRTTVAPRRIRLSRLRFKQLSFTPVTTNADLNVQEVKAGFDYKFGP